MSSFDPTKKAPKKVRGFSLSAESGALIDLAAMQYNTSASRIVDTAIKSYLSKVLAPPVPEKGKKL